MWALRSAGWATTMMHKTNFLASDPIYHGRSVAASCLNPCICGICSIGVSKRQIDNLLVSIIRSHTHCVEDAETLIPQSQDAAQRRAWTHKMDQADMVYRILTGGTGMPFFALRNLTRAWDLSKPGYP